MSLAIKKNGLEKLFYVDWLRVTSSRPPSRDPGSFLKYINLFLAWIPGHARNDVIVNQCTITSDFKALFFLVLRSLVPLISFLIFLCGSAYAHHSVQDLIDSGNINQCFLGNGTLQFAHKDLQDLKGIENVPRPDSITIIDMSHNNIKNLVGCSLAHFCNLKELWLNNNLLEDITPLGNIPGLEKLKVLNLSHNNIKYIYPEAFKNLTQLELLFLHHNQLTQLPSLQSLTNVRELHLMHNKLHTLDFQEFGALSMLYILNVGFNEIGVIRPLENGLLPNIEMLFLNNNMIAKIPSHTFTSCPNLQALYLHDNALNDLETKSFMGLHALRLLYLYNNCLTQLPAYVFVDMPNLHLLYLRNNALQVLAKEWCSGLEHLQVLDLSCNKVSESDLKNSGIQSLKKLKYLYAKQLSA